MKSNNSVGSNRTQVDMSVLVVDDEASVRRFVRRVLEAAGLRVLEAEDGVDALRLLDTIKPDLLLSDVRMPRMDGVTLAQELARRGFEIPILLMCGFADDPAHTALARARAVIQKPFMPEILVRMVIRTLRPPAKATSCRRPSAWQRLGGTR